MRQLCPLPGSWTQPVRQLHTSPICIYGQKITLTAKLSSPVLFPVLFFFLSDAAVLKVNLLLSHWPADLCFDDVEVLVR